MPTYRTQSLVYGRALGNAIAEALKTDPGAALIVAGKVRLSADPGFDPSPDAVLADLVAGEIAFSGYPAGGANLDQSGPVNFGTQQVGEIASALFVANDDDPFVSGVATGYWVDNGTDMMCGEKFPNDLVVAFGAQGDYLDLVVALPVDLLVDAALG